MFVVTLFGSKQTGSIFYMEAGQDFIDFLVSLLQLPCGASISLLAENGMLEGDSFAPAIAKLHSSIQKLPDSVLNASKESITNPGSVSIGEKAPEISWQKIDPILKLHLCSHCSIFAYDAFYTCPRCRSSTEVIQLLPSADFPKKVVGAYVKNMLFIVTDDLEILQLSTLEISNLLRRLNISSMKNIADIQVDVGRDQALSIMKAALSGSSVLNSVFGSNFKSVVAARKEIKVDN